MTYFIVAGVALAAFLLDEIDAPHDSLAGVAALAAGAIAGAIAGTADRRRAARGDAIAIALLQLVLAFELVRYGTSKVLGEQFYPQYWKLEIAPAALKPRWLAWVFFGRSYGYQAVAGALEILAGLLVVTRRTVLLGACLAVVVLTNVVLVNVFYDVPVKLISATYLLIAIALLMRFGAPLLHVFVRAAWAEPWRARLSWRFVGSAAVIVAAVAHVVRSAVAHGLFHHDTLEGAWSVDAMAGLDDLERSTGGAWDRLYFEKGGYGFVRAGGERFPFTATVDEARSEIMLALSVHESSETLHGTFTRVERRAHIAGTCRGHAFTIDATRVLP